MVAVEVRIVKVMGKIEIHTDYNPDYHEDFKDLIPAFRRSYDGVKRCWVIEKDDLPIVKNLLEEHFEFVNETLG